MSDLSPEVVAKVASLARLDIPPNELPAYARQLEQILDYIEMLDEVETERTEPLAHAGDAINVLRDDVRTESLPREQALANAPHTDGEFFLVPPILDQA